MQLTRLNPAFAVSGQIGVGDVAELAAAGFTVLVNNRPDGEASDQPSSAEIEAEATHRGLKYFYIPVQPGQDTEDEARRLADVLRGAAGPVLAYCRSGARSTNLWKAALQAGPADRR